MDELFINKNNLGAFTEAQFKKYGDELIKILIEPLPTNDTLYETHVRVRVYYDA